MSLVMGIVGCTELTKAERCGGHVMYSLPQNSIREENESMLKSGNACCHSVQNLVSSSLLSKNIKIKIYRTIIFACYFVWGGTWTRTLRGGT